MLNTKLFCLGAFLFSTITFAAEPIRLEPDNPHYFLFRGRPTVLITSGEHYGAVLNRAFDFRKYLDTLAADNLNLTRTFTGLYREVPGESFGITGNTLAPEEPDFVQPFLRLGPQKYDLSHWNEEYFRRWQEFVTYAGQLGIVVEVNLYTTYYTDRHWSLSPLNAANNVQGIGNVKSDEVLTLKEPKLVEVEERFVRKLVSALRDFDNVYYEVCNEPYFHGVTEAWQRRISQTITDADGPPPTNHLISRNIANGASKIEDPDPAVSLFNFHYARPPNAVAMNYELNKPIGMNETGFDGTSDAPYRIQAWDFLLAGGALYNNLDYSFSVGYENGTFSYPGIQPGGGSVRLRRQLNTLRQFMNSLPFSHMRPEGISLMGGMPAEASVRALSDGKSVWAIYVHGGRSMAGYSPQYIVYSKKRVAKLQLELPAGDYQIQWWQPRDGSSSGSEPFRSAGGECSLETPQYSEDIAAIIWKR